MAELKPLKTVKKIEKVEKLDAVEQQIVFLRKLATDKNLVKKFVVEPEKIARENGIEKLDTDVAKAVLDNVVANIPFTEKARAIIGEKNIKLAEKLKTDCCCILNDIEKFVEYVKIAFGTGAAQTSMIKAGKLDERVISRSSINKVTKFK